MSSYSPKKRKRPAWKDAPAFMDASATVTVGLFGARRLPELKELYAANQRQTKDPSAVTTVEQAFLSGGAKTSSRHLRRRTTAVERRKHRHRFPSGGSNRTSKSSSRKARRGKQSTLSQGHYEWHKPLIPRDTAEGNSTLVHWLPSHLWHAKRFHMETCWGWKVPLAHTNRGARAALRLEDEGRCSLQDVTYKRQMASISSTLSLSALVSLLSRICPEFAASKAILCSLQLGNGMLHQKDKFPLEAIGPVKWFVSCFKSADKIPQWRVQFMVHPSIFDNLTDCLQELMAETSDDIQWDHDASSLCCFQLYGSSASNVIRNALSPIESCKDSEWAWGQLPETQDLEHCLPHGSVVRVQLNLDARVDKSDNDIVQFEAFKKHLSKVQKAVERKNLEDERHDSSIQPEAIKQVLLVWQAPRPLDCSANRAVSGWDIYCSCPQTAKSIWMKLVLAGPCCPIGLSEESSLQLECSPPIPLFPRDFVDNEQGQIYWNCNDATWKLIRRIWEGGWGRLPIQRDGMKLPSVQWHQLVSSDQLELPDIVETQDGNNDYDTNSKQIVVARGVFAQPFIDALSGCGQLPQLTQPQRRNRRRARPFNKVVEAPRLSSEEVSSWCENCRSLRESLSLPAVLVCQVRVSGPGTVASGATVHCSATLLGVVTVGGFSLKRGVCHGMLVVGAGRLLEALALTKGCSGRVVRMPDGASRQIQLDVMIRNKGGALCQGTLSIIN